MGKMGEYLFFKLRPIASGYHGRLDNAEEITQEPRHFGVKRRLAFGQRAVQIEYDQPFHSGIPISSMLTAPRG